MLLLATTYTLIGAATETEIVKDNTSSNGISNEPTSVSDLPFYSSSSIFVIATFLVTCLIIMGKNCFEYNQYGVLRPNDFYTESHTLKVGALLISIFAGELFYIGMMSTFYVQKWS